MLFKSFSHPLRHCLSACPAFSQHDPSGTVTTTPPLRRASLQTLPFSFTVFQKKVAHPRCWQAWPQVSICPGPSGLGPGRGSLCQDKTDKEELTLEDTDVALPAHQTFYQVVNTVPSQLQPEHYAHTTRL